MKTIEVDEDLYRYIAGQTKHIGESASDILRRLLNLDGQLQEAVVAPVVEQPQGIVVSKDAGKAESVDTVKRCALYLSLTSLLVLRKRLIASCWYYQPYTN